jgi:hypothetical protein
MITKIMPAVALLWAQIFAVSLLAAGQDQAPKTAVEQQLAAQYNPTTVNRAGQVTAAGSSLVLKKNGLLMYTVTTPLPPQSTYKDGKISKRAFAGFGRDLLGAMSQPGASAAIPQRTFVAGEKVWVTKFTVEKDGLVARFYSDPIDDVTYFGELKFPFAKNVVPPADQLLSGMAEVFTVETAAPPPAAAPAAPADAPPPPIAPPPPPTDQPAAPTTTISLGLTIDQVVTALGQPDRVADLGARKIYFYKDLKITFTDGKVSDAQ